MKILFLPLLVIFLFFSVTLIPQLPDFFHALHYTQLLYMSAVFIIIIGVSAVIVGKKGI